MTRPLNYIKKYPLSILTLVFVCYLTFYRPVGYSQLIYFRHSDKIMHFAMYSFFCSVVWYEYFRSHTVIDMNRIFRMAVIAPISFSGALEILQSQFTTYRTGELLDFVFNLLGVLFAAFLSLVVMRPAGKNGL